MLTTTEGCDGCDDDDDDDDDDEDGAAELAATVDEDEPAIEVAGAGACSPMTEVGFSDFTLLTFVPRFPFFPPEEEVLAAEAPVEAEDATAAAPEERLAAGAAAETADDGGAAGVDGPTAFAADATMG